MKSVMASVSKHGQAISLRAVDQNSATRLSSHPTPRCDVEPSRRFPLSVAATGYFGHTEDIAG